MRDNADTLDATVTTPGGVVVEFRQHDACPGFAAYMPNADGSWDPSGPAFCTVNLGAFLQAHASGDMSREDMATALVDSMLHEVGHVLEHWAGAAFSEERVEAAIARYRGHAETVAVDPGMGFDNALGFLKAGARVRRKEWEEDVVWLEREKFGPKLVKGQVPFWIPYHAPYGDILAEDWEIVSG